MRDGSAFPTTLRTELLALVGPARDVPADAGRRAGAEKARIHVMERYAEPLAVFVRGSSLARLGEPAEIVNGFFASRLSDAGYLEEWARSGMRLRRWLMNGILFHGQGIARDRARAAARGTLDSSSRLSAIDELKELELKKLGLKELEARSPSAEARFERSWALAVVREATARVELELVESGRGTDFEIFRRHAIDGQPYATFARELGRTPQQCAGATRLVAQRVRARLAEVLREEGVPEEEIEDELARVRALVG